MNYEKVQNSLGILSLKSSEEERLVRDCKGKTFLQFNEVIGLPRKDTVEQDNKEFPIFDYEIDVVKAIRNNQHIWIKKARGLGITELVLRYLAWACLSTNRLQGKSIFIVSGTREEFANLLKERLADLFTRHYPNLQLESKYTELTLNKTWIKVFPTQQVKDLRGHIDVAYIFIDEADFFERIEQEELEAVITAYEEKSKAKIIMVSTPWLPDGLFQKIETDQIFKNTFHKMFLDYTYGLDRIYDNDFIQRKQNEPFFEAEYNLQYAGRIGNLFSQSSIDQAVDSYKYNPADFKKHSEKYIAVDIGYVKSKFAILIAEFLPKIRKVRILKAEEHQMPTYDDMLDRILEYRVQYGNVQNIAIDATSRMEFAMSLKKKIGEPYRWDYVKEKMEYCKRTGADIAKKMIVVPILFSLESKGLMTSHARRVLEHPRQYLAIDKSFVSLITGLRSALFDDRGMLDKQNTAHDDLVDCFMMLSTFLHFRERE